MSADPAFRGFVETTLDALLIFEGCRRGLLPKITRRLQEFEKRALVVSGAVFVFDEEETGIKRWTDGLSWSPSRTLGNFLVYRELDKKAGAAGGADELEDGLDELPTPGDPIAGPSSGRTQPASSARRRSLSDTSGATPPLDRARERALVGSLTSTYRFRSDGLVKKTISLAGLHMIGYYRIEDVTSGRLRTPSSHAELISLEVSSDFLSPTHFRVPPIVEMASDGHLTYKGEADAPMSPLTRSGSSQGFTTPALGGPVRSRPPSSDSTQLGRPSSPRLPPLPMASRDAPNSPHRGSTATFRSANRYDPYAVGRSSPNLGSFQQAPSYPFPDAHQRPASPPRGSFPILAGDDLYRSADGSTGLSPALGMLSSSAPTTDQQWGRSSVSGQPPLPLNRQSSDQTVPSFYQPRHATPFAPGEPSMTSTASASSIFAYQPPPPPPPPSRPGLPPSRGSQGRGSPPATYQSYNAPLPASQSMPPHSQASSFAPAPTYRAPYPPSFPHQQSQHSHHSHQQSLPPHSQSMHSSHGLNSSTSSNPTYAPYPNPRPPSGHAGDLSPLSSTYDYIPPPPTHSHQAPPPHPQAMYSHYAPPPPQSPLQASYGYADPRGSYSDPRQPSGMVMPLGSGDLDEERHGLGLASAGGSSHLQHHQLGSSSGRSSAGGGGGPQDVYGGSVLLNEGPGPGDDERFAPRTLKREPDDPPQWWNSTVPPQPQPHHQRSHHLQHQSPGWGGGQPAKDEYS